MGEDVSRDGGGALGSRSAVRLGLVVGQEALHEEKDGRVSLTSLQRDARGWGAGKRTWSLLEKDPELVSELATHDRPKAAEHLLSLPEGTVNMAPFCSRRGVVLSRSTMQTWSVVRDDKRVRGCWHADGGPTRC